MFTGVKRWVNSPGFPDPFWLKFLEYSVRYTPDIMELESKAFQLLFCVGDTRRKESFHHLVEESAFLFHGFTKDRFELYEYGTKVASKDQVFMRNQAIPLATTGPRLCNYFPPHLRIKGEVLAIKPWQFVRLDNHMENTVQYTRKRVRLIVPFREVLYLPEYDVDGRKLPTALLGKQGVHGPERVTFVSAWMYVANQDYWGKLIDQGYSGAFRTATRYQSRKSWLKEYYNF